MPKEDVERTERAPPKTERICERLGGRYGLLLGWDWSATVAGHNFVFVTDWREMVTPACFAPLTAGRGGF